MSNIKVIYKKDEHIKLELLKEQKEILKIWEFEIIYTTKNWILNEKLDIPLCKNIKELEIANSI